MFLYMYKLSIFILSTCKMFIYIHTSIHLRQHICHSDIYIYLKHLSIRHKYIKKAQKQKD